MEATEKQNKRCCQSATRKRSQFRSSQHVDGCPARPSLSSAPGSRNRKPPVPHPQSAVAVDSAEPPAQKQALSGSPAQMRARSAVSHTRRDTHGASATWRENNRKICPLHSLTTAKRKEPGRSASWGKDLVHLDARARPRPHGRGPRGLLLDRNLPFPALLHHPRRRRRGGGT